MARTEDVVTSWKLDAQEFRKGVKSINSGLANIKAGFDMAIGAARSLVEAWDKLATQGAQLDRLQRNNTLSIDAATKATKGYVTQIDLLKSANMAAAFDLGFTDEQFAKVAKSAVIMSQKLGTDATQAISDLIVGLSRQSKKILDNLGIMVSVKEANEDYAATMGIVGRKLTDTEQKQAFMNATMKELDRLTTGASLSVANAGDKYEVLKNQISDSTAELAKAIIKTGLAKDAMAGFAMVVGDTASMVSFLSSSTTKLATSSSKLIAQLQRMVSFADSPMVKYLLMGGMTTGVNFAGINKMLGKYRQAAELREAAAHWDKVAKEGSSAQQEALWTGQGDPYAQGIMARYKWNKPGAAGKGAGRGKGRGRRAGAGGRIDVAPMGIEPTRSVDDALNDMIAETQERAKQISVNADLARSIQKKKAAEEDAAKAARKHSDELRRQENLAKDLNESYINLALGGLQSFATGLWSAADAAIMGSESFGMAMAKMLKDTLMSIASQSTVKALFETAEGFAALATYRPVEATQHFTAAGIYGAVAVTAGAAGLATSAGIAAAGGYSSGGSAESTSAATGDYSSRFSGAKSTKQQPINVNVYVGDPDDPSSALIMQKQLKAQLKAA